MPLFRTTVALAAVVVGGFTSVAPGAEPITIVALGDSYINSFGIVARADRFSGKVETALADKGFNVVVQDAGMKNSSLDALNWLEGPAGKPLLDSPAHHVLVLEIGDNDCLLFGLDKTSDNLDRILSILASKKIPVLVVGTIPHEECMVERGAAYATDYPAMYSRLAAKYGNLLYPDFKAGIEGREDLMFHDHIHPNRTGEAIIVANMLPALEALIGRLP